MGAGDDRIAVLLECRYTKVSSGPAAVTPRPGLTLDKHHSRRSAMTPRPSIRACLLPAIVLSFSLSIQAASQPRKATIILQDETQIIGTVMSLKDGVYQVKSEALGELRIPAERVARITFGDQAKPAPLSAPLQEVPTGDVLDGLLKTLMSNRTVMGKVEKLQQDKDIQAILNDPEIMQAIEQRDIMKLLNNKKLRSLMEKPEVKDITESVDKAQNK